MNDDPKRRALGRGLEALLPSKRQLPASDALASGESRTTGIPVDIPLDTIDRSPFQTRTQFDPEKLKELAQSITSSGVIQPVVVRSLSGGRYQLIAGERRLLASRAAGRSTIPAVVRAVSDEQAMEMTVVENLQRADLNPMEQARAYQRLSQEFRMTHEQIAIRTGKDRASISNFLRLLRLPASVQKRVESAELLFGHARALLGLQSAEQMAEAAETIFLQAMSVRQTELYVQGLIHPESKGPKSKKAIEPLDPNVTEARDLLQRRLGLRVQIQDKQGRGRVIIDYANVDDFDLILGVLGVLS